MGQETENKQNHHTERYEEEQLAQNKGRIVPEEDKSLLSAVFNVRCLTVLAALMGIYHLVVRQLSYFLAMETYQKAEMFICLVLLAYYIIYWLVNKPTFHFRAEYCILICLMIWYLVSTFAMNEKMQGDWWLDNKNLLIDTAITLLVYFPLGDAVGRSIASGKKMMMNNLKIFLHILLACWTVFILFVLINVFQQNVINLPGGGKIEMNRQAALCLNCHYNTTGAWQMLFTLTCIMMAIWVRHPIGKILYGIGAAINLVAQFLANSRTSYISTVVGCSLTVLVAVYRKLRNEKEDGLFPIKGGQLIIGLGAAIVTGAVLVGARSAVYSVFQSVTHFNEQMNGTEGKGMIVREVFDSTTSTLTGRTDIWAAALKGMFSTVQNFFLGVTPIGVTRVISRFTGGEYNLYTHNVFLEVGVSLGVPAMCAFLVWFVLILKSGYRQMKRNLGKLTYLMVLLTTLMLSNMTEGILLFHQFINGFAFFFLCGWIYGNEAWYEQKAGNRKG